MKGNKRGRRQQGTLCQHPRFTGEAAQLASTWVTCWAFPKGLPLPASSSHPEGTTIDASYYCVIETLRELMNEHLWCVLFVFTPHEVIILMVQKTIMGDTMRNDAM